MQPWGPGRAERVAPGRGAGRGLKRAGRDEGGAVKLVAPGRGAGRGLKLAVAVGDEGEWGWRPAVGPGED